MSSPGHPGLRSDTPGSKKNVCPVIFPLHFVLSPTKVFDLVGG